MNRKTVQGKSILIGAPIEFIFMFPLITQFLCFNCIFLLDKLNLGYVRKRIYRFFFSGTLYNVLLTILRGYRSVRCKNHVKCWSIIIVQVIFTERWHRWWLKRKMARRIRTGWIRVTSIFDRSLNWSLHRQRGIGWGSKASWLLFWLLRGLRTSKNRGT